MAAEEAKVAKESNADLAKPQEGGSLLVANVELLKAILEFLGRCLYPAIIVAVLWVIAPSILKIDFSELAKRLSSFKAGSTELTFSDAQDVGDERAVMNGKFASLERTLNSVRSDLSRMQDQSGKMSGPKELLNETSKAEQQFKANSGFTVLVFYRRTAEHVAREIAKSLLSAGFVSSATETDFSELRRTQTTPGTIYLQYGESGKPALEDIHRLVEKISAKDALRMNANAVVLRRGDVQVFVF